MAASSTSPQSLSLLTTVQEESSPARSRCPLPAALVGWSLDAEDLDWIWVLQSAHPEEVQAVYNLNRSEMEQLLAAMTGFCGQVKA